VLEPRPTSTPAAYDNGDTAAWLQDANYMMSTRPAPSLRRRVMQPYPSTRCDAAFTEPLPPHCCLANSPPTTSTTPQSLNHDALKAGQDAYTSLCTALMSRAITVHCTLRISSGFRLVVVVTPPQRSTVSPFVDHNQERSSRQGQGWSSFMCRDTVTSSDDLHFD
jgi:hypothetical protein